MKLLMLVALLLFSPWLIAANCQNSNLQSIHKIYLNAVAEQNWQEARTALQKLSTCLPNRGDLRIERLRLALRDNDLEAAREQRKWLKEHNIPPALEQMIDAWIAATTADRNATPAAPKSHYSLFTLTQGYDSNANDGSRHDSIPITLNGLPLRWSLDSSSQKQPSAYTELGLHTRSNTLTQWALGLTAKHYSNLNSNDLNAYLQLSTPIPCPKFWECRIQGRVDTQHQDEQQQLQLQLSLDARWQQHQAKLSLRHIDEHQSTDSKAISFQWRTRINPHLTVYSGYELNKPVESRAGGNRHSVHAAANLRPIKELPLEFNLLHLREYESSPYATAFWQDRHRDRRLTRLTSNYTWPLRRNLSLRMEAGISRTDSEIELFQQQGWNTALKLIGTL